MNQDMKDTILNSVKNTWEIEAQSIRALADDTDKEALLKAVEAIGGMKGKAIVSGCGTSGAAAKKIAHSLCCVERPAMFLSPADAVHGALGMLQKDDVLILITKGGNTQEIVNMIPACKEKGAYLIGITENPDSVLGRNADLLLKVKVAKEPCPFNMLATASTLAVIALFDAICIALMHYTSYTREQFALIHPGGAVGERLLGNKA
jgi:KpsF/GutQ family protein